MAQIRRKKMKRRRKLMEEEGCLVTWRIRYSKMSGEGAAT